MFEVKMNKFQMFGILLCVTLCGVVTTQEALPYQYTPPYQNAFNHDLRRYNAPYGDFNVASMSSNRDLVRFPDDGMSPVNLVGSVNIENNFNGRRKKDNRDFDESHLQKTNEVSGLM